MILVVVAALPVIVFAGLAREERSLGRKWLARGILASSFVAGAALAAGTVPLIAAIAGDAEPAAVRLHNATDHDNYLVTPLTQPTERSAAHYRRIPPRDHGYPNDRRDRDTNWQTCLTDSPGTVLTLADNYTPVRYRDPQTGQHLSQDPPASAVLSEVQLPAGVCFEDRDPWLGFDGTTVTSIEDPRRGFVHYAIATIAVIATILATTDAIDRSVERLRPRA